MGLTQSNPWRGVRFGYVFSFVIPAKAGIQLTLNRMSSNWIPAYAGMTGMGTHPERTSCQKVQRQELPVGWIRLPVSTSRMAKTAKVFDLKGGTTETGSRPTAAPLEIPLTRLSLGALTLFPARDPLGDKALRTKFLRC